MTTTHAHPPYDWNNDRDHLLREKRRETLADLMGNLRDACDQLQKLLTLPDEPVTVEEHNAGVAALMFRNDPRDDT